MNMRVNADQTSTLLGLELGQNAADLRPPAGATPSELMAIVKSVKQRSLSQISTKDLASLQLVVAHRNADNAVVAAAKALLTGANLSPGLTSQLQRGDAASANPVPAPSSPNTRATTNAPQRTGNAAAVRGGAARKVSGPYAAQKLAKIPNTLAGIIGTPEEKLDLGQIKGWYSWAKTQSDMFVVPAEFPFPDLGIPGLPNKVTVTTRANQYLLEDGVTMGNRVAIYGEDWGELVKAVHELGGFLSKQMLHRRKDGDRLSLNSTHKGCMFAVFDENGKPKIGLVDFPTDYGNPHSGTDEYTFRTCRTSTDQMEFERQPTDVKELDRISNGMSATHMALFMAKGVFASGDPRRYNAGYTVNNLDIKNVNDLKVVERALTMKDDDIIAHPQYGDMKVSKFLQLKSQYCAEGEQSGKMLKMWATSTPAYEEMGAIFNTAVEAERLNRGPDAKPDNRVGWTKLKDEGFISQSGLSGLLKTDMAYVPFTIPPANYQPPGSYGPKGIIKEGPFEGMMQKPISVAGLVAGAFALNIPRKDIAEAGAGIIKGAYLNAGAQTPAIAAGIAKEVNAGIAKLKEAGVPVSNENILKADATPSEIADAFGKLYASHVQTASLKSEKMTAQIHKHIRYKFMDPASQKRIDGMLTKYIAVTSDFTRPLGNLHTLINSMNEALREETFTFKLPHPDRPEEIETITSKGLVYLPPHFDSLADHGWVQSAGTEVVTDWFSSGYAKQQ